jgi:hypothetical protein
MSISSKFGKFRSILLGKRTEGDEKGMKNQIENRKNIEKELDRDRMGYRNGELLMF